MLKVKEREGVWYVAGTYQGQRVRKSTGLPASNDNLIKAETILQREVAEIDARKGVTTGVRGVGYTVEMAVDDYQSDRMRRGDPVGYNQGKIIEKFREYWGDTEVNGISNKDITDWIDNHLYVPTRSKQVTRLSPSTVATILQHFKAVLKNAMKAERIERMPYIPMPFLGPGRDIHLDHEEVKQFLEWVRANHPNLELVFAVLIYTGARLNEALRITWADVEGEVTINRKLTKSKTKQTREIPLGKTLWPILNRHRGAKKATLFEDLMIGKTGVTRVGNTDRSPLILSQWLNPILREGMKAIDGPEDIVVHDLRHTFAYLTGQIGVDLGDLQKMMGHTEISNTMRYRGFIKSRAADLMKDI